MAITNVARDHVKIVVHDVAEKIVLADLRQFQGADVQIMLARANVSEAQKTEALLYYRDARERFTDALRVGIVNLLLYPPDEDAPRIHSVNFSLDLLELSLEYTPEEYAEHIAAVVEPVKHEQNFHLTLLPSAPFRDIQIVTLQDAVAVLRCHEPFAAFVFLDSRLTISVTEYFAALVELHESDRETTLRELEANIA